MLVAATVVEKVVQSGSVRTVHGKRSPSSSHASLHWRSIRRLTRHHPPGRAHDSAHKVHRHFRRNRLAKARRSCGRQGSRKF